MRRNAVDVENACLATKVGYRPRRNSNTALLEGQIRRMAEWNIAGIANRTPTCLEELADCWNPFKEIVGGMSSEAHPSLYNPNPIPIPIRIIHERASNTKIAVQHYFCNQSSRGLQLPHEAVILLSALAVWNCSVELQCNNCGGLRVQKG